MTELARLGFLLLGLHVVLSPLSFFAIQISKEITGGDLSFLLVGAFWLVFSLVPGVFLIWQARALSIRLFGPSEGGGSEIETGSLVAAGIVVAGVWLFITGATNLASAGASAVMTASISNLAPFWVRDAVQGGLFAILGVGLALKAKSISRLLVRDPSSPAV